LVWLGEVRYAAVGSCYVRQGMVRRFEAWYDMVWQGRVWWGKVRRFMVRTGGAVLGIARRGAAR